MDEPSARINVEIPQQLADRMDKIIRWGMKSLLIRSLLEMAMDDIEEHGIAVLDFIIDKRYNPLDKKGRKTNEHKT